MQNRNSTYTFTGLNEYDSSNVGLVFYAHYTTHAQYDDCLTIDNYLLGTSLRLEGPRDVLAKLDNGLTVGMNSGALQSALIACLPDATSPLDDLVRGGLVE